jgi:prevent-host-death family protein
MSDDTWQLQDAKARFSELLDKVESEGPQIVTRRGKEAAVVVSVETWRDMEKRARPVFSIKDWLLAPEARTENLVPPRRKHRRRPAPDLTD